MEIHGGNIKGSPSGSSDKDTHALGFGGITGILIEDANIDANGCSEGLKLSKCWSVNIDNCVIQGGTEDCVDICRGGEMIIRDCAFVSKGQYCITIKASARDISFINCHFKGSPSQAFIDLGNWSDYDIVDRPKTRRISFTDCTFETKWYKFWVPAVRVLWAELPKFNGCSNTTTISAPNWAIKIFFWCRRRGWFGGKVTVGPAELVVSEKESI